MGVPSEEESFRVYLEYMLMCYVEPEYPRQVAASPRHTAYYSRAVDDTEFRMTRAR